MVESGAVGEDAAAAAAVAAAAACWEVADFVSNVLFVPPRRTFTTSAGIPACLYPARQFNFTHICAN